MTKIHLQTNIYAPVNICFDLARSIDFHQISIAQSKEKAIAGVTSGLINLNESVTWEAIHFGIKQQLTSKITAMEIPDYFRDEQTKGIFKSMIHHHYFDSRTDKTVMIDEFYYKTPFGIFGKIFDVIILKKYLTKMLYQRNQMIKDYAETEKWKTILI